MMIIAIFVGAVGFGYGLGAGSPPEIIVGLIIMAIALLYPSKP